MKENNLMRLTAMALLIGAVASANAGTYYKIGVDGSNESSFNGTFSENTGWATSRDGAIGAVTDMENSDFIIQSKTTVRTPSTGGGCKFSGKSLVLETGGTLMTKGRYNDPSFDVQNLVAQGGTLQVNENRAPLHTFTGSISIVEDSSLTVHLHGDGQQAIINSELTGDDSTTLYITTAKILGDKGQVLEISDADKFYGTIEAGSESAEPFTLKITGGFGGTITSLPSGTTKFVVNYDEVSAGLRIATTTIPAPLKSSVVFYSAAGIKGETVLMTFPKGATVNADEFSIYAADGVNETSYPLYFKSVENEDGTVSLVTYITYYKKGYDENKYTSFDGYYTGSDETVGWSDTRNLTSVVSVKDMATSVFVVNGQRLRTPIGESNFEFKGKALVLETGGVLMTKSGGMNATYTLPNLIGNGGGILFNESDKLHTIAGNISIVGNSSLNVALNADGQNAVVSSKLTGDTSTTLYITTAEEDNIGEDGQVLEISDADEFLGAIKAGSKSTEPFILKLTGGLGGTIASLPAGTTQVLVNYEELGDAGLRIGTTEIPAAIKTGVTFYADRTFADGTVLMTFPEGTEVNLADFNVCWSREIDGRASRFVRLATVANEDGTVSLVKSSYGTVISFR